MDTDEEEGDDFSDDEAEEQYTSSNTNTHQGSAPVDIITSKTKAPPMTGGYFIVGGSSVIGREPLKIMSSSSSSLDEWVGDMDLEGES